MKLSFFAEKTISSALCEKGLSEREAEKKAILFSKVVSALIEAGIDGDRESFGHFVPGRIEVLGKHTDMVEGGALLQRLNEDFVSWQFREKITS